MTDESQLSMNMVEETPSHFQQESASEVIQTTGSILESTRKSQNRSVQQVSEQLKLSQAQIIAIESNQYHLLPTLVIVRGFVRAYAKLLRIDAEPLIALLPKDDNPKSLGECFKPPLSAPFVDSKLNLLGKSETNKFYIIGAIIIVLLVAVFLISQNAFVKNLIESQLSTSQQKANVENVSVVPNQANSTSNTSQNTAVVLTNPINKTDGATVLNGQEVAANNTAAATSDAVTTSASNNTTPQAAIVVADKTLTQAGQVPVVTTPTTPPVVTTSVPTAAATAAAVSSVLPVNKGNNALVLKFRQNSWMQIKTEKGVVIAERLVKAGSEEKFDVNQALLVRIGNAAGVDVSLRGASLDLSRAGGSNVANLSIK